MYIMKSFIPEIVIIKSQRNKQWMRLVTSAKDKQKFTNQPETNKCVETIQNIDIYLLSNKGKTIGKLGKCKRKEKENK